VKKLELYLNSLTKNARASIDSILNNNRIISNKFIDGEISETVIEYQDNPKLSIIESSDINIVLSDIEYSHRKMWNVMLTVDSSIRSLSKRTRDSLALLESAKNKLSYAYLKLRTNLVNTEYKSVYTESYNDYSGTDKDQTNATIFGGILSMKKDEEETTIEDWNIVYINVPNNNEIKRNISSVYISSEPVDNPIGEFVDDGIYVSAIKDFTIPINTAGISLNSSGKCVIDKIVVKENTNIDTVVVENYQITPGINHIIFDKFYNCISIKIYIRQYMYTIDNVITLDQATVYTNSILNFIKFVYGVIEDIWINIANTFRIRTITNKSYIYTLNIDDIKFLNTTVSQNSYWVSQPINIRGNINNLKIDADVDNGEYGNVKWFVSVDSSEYIPIVENELIENELLVFDNTRIARLTYPIDKTKPYFLSEELEFDLFQSNSGETSIYLKNEEDLVSISSVGNLIGMTYYTTLTGEVKLDEIGSNTNSVKIKEAVFNDQKGERFLSTENRQVYLTYVPEGNMEIYCDGILAQELPYDKTFSDYANTTNYIYYRLNNKTITFSSDVVNIVVFYYYKESNVRIKAILTSLRPWTGSTSKVNQLNISIGGSE
jgi:hypothetical protein